MAGGRNTAGPSVPAASAKTAVDPFVVVWPSRDVAGMDSPDDAADVLWHPVRPLREALTAHYETDAHLCALVAHEAPEAPEAPLVAHEAPEAAPDAPLMVPDSYSQPRLNSGALRALKDRGVECLVTTAFVDVDNPGHKPWSDLPGGMEAAERTLLTLLDTHADAGGVLERAAVYMTRAGWRAVYALDPPVPAALYAGMMGRPYADHRGDPSGLLGWFAQAILPAEPKKREHVGRVDASCSSPLRCYRAPRALRDGQITDPPVLDLEGLDVGPLDVRPWLESAAARKDAPSPILVDVSRPSHDPLTPTAWAAAGLEGMLRKRYPSTKGRMGLGAAIRARKPWFGPGERNEASFQAVCLLLELLYKPMPPPAAQDAADFTYRALAPGIITACAEGISSTDIHAALDELWEMIVKRIAVETGRVESRIAEIEKQEAARVAVATAAGKPEMPPDEGASEYEVPIAPDPVAEEMALAPILAVGSGYMILDARDPTRPTYFPYTRNQDLVMALLLRGCGDRDPEEGEGPLGLELRGSDGRLRQMRNLVIDYGVQITDVVIAHGTDRPILDYERGRLQLPGATAIPVEAEYDEQIASWLEMLGGDDAEALLDWLATMTRLDKPTCAIYLQGEPGTGKGLFAACCTSVFGAGFNKFETACSRFNAGLSKSPIIFLDEKADTKGSEHTSSAFRSLVAETEHRVEPKGQEVMTIRGAMRMIIAANNPDALPLIGAHTQADIEAITSRIRWFDVSDEAATYLRHIGGREVTAAWIGNEGSPGKFARHVRWLEENRTVKPGLRFLVEGKLCEYHELLVLTAERLQVLNAVTKAILAGPNQAKSAGVLIEPATAPPYSVAVNVGMIRGKWYGLTGDRIVPSQTQITEALSALGGVKPVRRMDLRYFTVPMRYLILACQRLGLPDWTVADVIEKAAKHNATLVDGRGGSRPGAGRKPKAPQAPPSNGHGSAAAPLTVPGTAPGVSPVRKAAEEAIA